jgi:threonine-phosphate decarboxylase
MPESVRRAVAAGAGEDERYPDPYCRRLRRALSARFGVEPEQILCGNGASDLILRLCACLRPRTVLTCAPTFSEYGRCAALYGAALRTVPLAAENGFAPDRGFLNALTDDVDMVFLCSPNNPTGRLWDPDLLEEIAAACAANGTYLVVDECFIEFTEGRSVIPLLERFPRLLILRAFTKIYAMAGLRLGFLLCGDAGLLDRIAAFGAEWSVSTVAQRAGLAALGETGWMERTRALVAGERRWLTERLTALGLTVCPSQANFLLVRGSRPLREPLSERGLMVRGCRSFAGLDDNWFRMGIKTRAENEILMDTLKEVLYG